jgi:hypothetical protein
MLISDILFGIPNVCLPTEFSTKILYYFLICYNQVDFTVLLIMITKFLVV